MTERFLRRFILVGGLVTFAGFTLWLLLQQFAFAPAGDYEVRKGDILLSEGAFERALPWFERALALTPDHRGALMGRAIVLMQTERLDEAEAALTHLIDHLTATLAADDPTGRGVLAGAYANRGILHDRSERYQQALADYRAALRIDQGAVAGPGLFHKIIYGTAHPATVEKRARYLEAQLALPADQRLLRVPEIDAEQRMFKP